jgi:hypothetical protein
MAVDTAAQETQGKGTVPEKDSGGDGGSAGNRVNPSGGGGDGSHTSARTDTRNRTGEYVYRYNVLLHEESTSTIWNPAYDRRRRSELPGCGGMVRVLSFPDAITLSLVTTLQSSTRLPTGSDLPRHCFPLQTTAPIPLPPPHHYTQIKWRGASPANFDVACSSALFSPCIEDPRD